MNDPHDDDIPPSPASAEAIARRHGLFKNVPRSLRTAVVARLTALEGDPARFDREALAANAQVKRLYALLHVRPGARAQATLFDRAPVGGARDALRALSRERDPGRAAALVRAHQIPFRLVAAAMREIPAAVGRALVEGAADIDALLSSLRFLARRGLIVGEARGALLERLAASAAEGPPLPWRKVEAVARMAGLDREVTEAIYRLARAPKSAALTGDTALLVDGSVSVARAGGCLELAAQVGVRVDAALPAEARLVVLAFGAEVVPVDRARRADLGRWRDVLRVPATALGHGTCPGGALDFLARHEPAVDRVVLVTDGTENRAPRLAGAVDRYRASTGRAPSLCLVQPHDGARQLTTDLARAGEAHELFTADPHLTGLDALLPTLAARGADDLYAEIAAWPA